jgi:hypothetical protein
MAFAQFPQARLSLCPAFTGHITALQASLDVADRQIAPLRFGPGISAEPGSFTTGDLGVSPDRTCTSWSSRACSSVTS